MSEYSYTRLKLYSDCPAAFKATYRDGLAAVPGENLQTGRLLHTIVEIYIKHLIKSGQALDPSAIEEIAGDAFHAEPHGLEPGDFEEILKVAVRFANAFSLNLDSVVGSEEWFSHDVDGHAMRGKMDLLSIEGDAATITDWKSDFALRTQADVEKDFQLLIYAWAALREYPQLTRFKVRLHFLRHNVVREVELTLEDVAKTQDRLSQMIARAEADQTFKPTPGQHCAWCAAKMLCPLKLDGITTCGSADEAADLYGRLLVLEAQADEIKEALKPWCNQAGAVQLNGMEIGFFPSVSQKVEDVGTFCEALQEAGEEFLPYLSVDNRKAAKLSKQERFADLFTEATSTSFRSRKQKAGKDE